jgi:biopolymer transport protein ExbD/DNA-directed RNA polymerase subunit RPC12/RpoP
VDIRFHCTNCGKRLKADSSRAGRSSVCPRCSTTVVVPDVSDSQESLPVEMGGAENDEHGHLPSGGAMPLMRPHQHHSEDLIDMTAMVDIVFFLLIFFMIMSIQDIESVIGLPAPQANSSSPATAADFANDPNYITVTIYEDDTVWVEDEQAFGPLDLRARLRAARKSDQLLTGMLVVGSPESSHGTFVMVIDAGADVGLGELMFSVPDQLDAVEVGG